MSIFEDQNNRQGQTEQQTQTTWQNPTAQPYGGSQQVQQYAYNPYQTGGPGGGGERPRKKGMVGVIIACTLSAALVGGTLGGIGGLAVGYSIAPKQQTVSTAQVEAIVAEMLAEAQPTAVPVASASGAMSIAEIATKVSPSVVAIDSTITMKQNTPFGTYQSEGQGSGSGIVIREDGYILTNNHVVEGAKSVTVVMSDGKEYEAHLVGRDVENDIAVIKVEAEGLTAIEIGTSGTLQVGDIAIAVGNPLGRLAGSVTQGIVSALEREITIDGDDMVLLQFDAAVNQGNSGGALVNGQGQLVGVVNAKTSAVGVEGIGFAIPIDHVKEIIDDIIENGTGLISPEDAKLTLGITSRVVTEEIAEANDLPTGLYITEIEEFSAADRAGLRAGDIILYFDGVRIEDNETLIEVRDRHVVGDTVEVVVDRRGKEMTLELTFTAPTGGF